MIYAGLVHFNEAGDKVSKLRAVLEAYTQTPPTVVTKNSLTLCYGKLSNENDMDEIWENDSTILMGRLFDKTHHCTVSKQDFKNLSPLSKEELLAKLWGKYVSIHANEKVSQFDIIVDSTGQLPFFITFFPIAIFYLPLTLRFCLNCSIRSLKSIGITYALILFMEAVVQLKRLFRIFMNSLQLAA